VTASVASFLTQAQKKGKELPTALSGALLLAAVRLSDAKAQAIRPYQLLVDDDGALDLLTGEPPTGDGYAAPELRNGAVLSDDPRVLVYAAGALGYELITLTPPRGQAGQEVQGPLAPVIRKAMAERQHRYKSLADMARAIERIQGRPGREEERLILAAVAGSTPLPAAQKLAKIELGRTAIPEGASAPPVEPAGGEAQPVFTQVWDPLEPQAAPAATPPPPAEPARPAPDVLEPLRVELEAERKARKDLTAALESRMSELAQMGTRLALLEEQVRSPPAPQQSLSAAAALARDAQHLLEQRRFGEAEKLLQNPLAANDPVLMFRLGQALCSMTDPDGALKARAVGAFRRAADLDGSWAEPRARLGALLWRQGRESEARTHLETALKLDPRCSEALAILTPAAPRKSRLALPAVAGTAALLSAAVVAFILLRPLPAGSARGSLAAPPVALSALPPAPPPAQPTSVPDPAPAAPPPVPPVAAVAPSSRPKAAALPELPPPERKRKREPEPELEPEPRPQRATRPDPKPRPKKVASASRSAAEAESAKGDRALRAFDTKSAESAFSAALQLDPSLPAAHRGMGMVYVLLGKNAEAKAAYARYLQLSPDAPDKEQIARLLSR
jgi:tetratricopeptide (TPR) repeat protein